MAVQIVNAYAVSHPSPSLFNLYAGESGRFKFQIQNHFGSEAVSCSAGMDGESPLIVEFDDNPMFLEAYTIRYFYGTVTVPIGTESGYHTQKYCIQCFGETPSTGGGGTISIRTCGLPVNVLVLTQDSDEDGVLDDEDLCPQTPESETVNEGGCSCSQIEIPFRSCQEDQCGGEYWVEYPEGGYDTCEAGEITEEYSCEAISSTYSEECDTDDDNDGILDDEDKCPNTVDEQIIDGCSCNQILELKPGEDTATNREGCSKGIINVFENAIGWAKDLFE